MLSAAEPKNPKPPPPPRQKQNKPPQQKANPGRAGVNAAQRPGDQALQRLSQMSPADRQKALANLPPERRAQVLKRLQDYQTLSPQARQRAMGQLNRLQSLPPEKQGQVRKSLQKLQQLPEDRKAAVGAELDRLGAMSPTQRTARMSSPEFKSQYSDSERQMMGDISQVLPPGKEPAK
jgi:phage-related protein